VYSPGSPSWPGLYAFMGPERKEENPQISQITQIKNKRLKTREWRLAKSPVSFFNL